MRQHVHRVHRPEPHALGGEPLGAGHEIAPAPLPPSDQHGAAPHLLHAELAREPEQHRPQHGWQRHRRLHLGDEERDGQPSPETLGHDRRPRPRRQHHAARPHAPMGAVEREALPVPRQCPDGAALPDDRPEIPRAPSDGRRHAQRVGLSPGGAEGPAEHAWRDAGHQRAQGGAVHPLEREPRLPLPGGHGAEPRGVFRVFHDPQVPAPLVLERDLEPALEIGPEPYRLQRQRHLRKCPRLLAHPARVHARGLAADAPGLQQEHLRSPLRQEVRAGRAHDATTDDDDVHVPGDHGHAGADTTTATASRRPRARPP